MIHLHVLIIFGCFVAQLSHVWDILALDMGIMSAGTVQSVPCRLALNVQLFVMMAMR